MVHSNYIQINDSTVVYINDLADHSELIIKDCFGLSDEDMEKFRTLSKARKQVMLEEGWTEKVRVKRIIFLRFTLVSSKTILFKYFF